VVREGSTRSRGPFIKTKEGKEKKERGFFGRMGRQKGKKDEKPTKKEETVSQKIRKPPLGVS